MMLLLLLQREIQTNEQVRKMVDLEEVKRDGLRLNGLQMLH